MKVMFHWSPMIDGELPGQLDLPAVPRAGDFLLIDDERIGVVKHVTWGLNTGDAYVYVEKA